MKLSCLPLAALLLFLNLYNAAEAGPSRKAPKQTKVLILGAGVAGIMAAKTLKDNGVEDFLILEAQNYIGGRYKNVPFADTRIEEGANWVHHTEEENALWDLAKKYKLKGNFTFYTDFVIRNEDGRLQKNTKKIIHEMHETEERIIKLQSARAKKHFMDLNIRAGMQMVGWKPTSAPESVVEYFSMDFEFGSKPEKSSTNGFTRAGKDYFVHDPRGYGCMWLEIAKEFQEKIILNTAVSKVRYNNRKLVVTTRCGDNYIADYGLVTFSHGVLSSDAVTFQPSLPDWKLESIYKMPMAVYTKIFIKFPYKFWDDSTWILYAHKNRGYFPVWMNVEIPGVAPNSGILHVTVTDEEGKRVENQPKEQTLREIMKELRKVYGEDIPEPEEIFCSKWSKNPYVRGSYSNAASGTTSEDFHNLQTPVKRLYFAGEATSEDWWGYGNGAHETGILQAGRILKCINSKCEKILPKANTISSVTLATDGKLPKRLKQKSDSMASLFEMLIRKH